MVFLKRAQQSLVLALLVYASGQICLDILQNQWSIPLIISLFFPSKRKRKERRAELHLWTRNVVGLQFMTLLQSSLLSKSFFSHIEKKKKQEKIQ